MKMVPLLFVSRAKFSADILELKGKMVPLFFAFLALPCLGKQGATKGLNQLIKEEDKFHLLTEVWFYQIHQKEDDKLHLLIEDWMADFHVQWNFSSSKNLLSHISAKSIHFSLVMCLCIWVILGPFYYERLTFPFFSNLIQSLYVVPDSSFMRELRWWHWGRSSQLQNS